MELIGIGDYGNQVIGYLGRVLINMFNHAYNRCVTNHDPGEVRNMLAAARQLQLLGDDGLIDLTKADACLTFHLDYQLTAHNVVDTARPLTEGTLDVSSMGNVMTFRLIRAALEADLPMTVNSWSWYDYLCNRTGGTGTGATPAHAVLTFSLNPTTGPNGVITFGTPTFQMQFSPGTLTLLNACGLDGFSRVFYPDIWRTPFKDLPVDPVTKAILIDTKEWTYQGGEIYATVDDQRSMSPAPDDNWTAHLRFTLHHDPQPKP